jgi:hypothetical protein
MKIIELTQARYDELAEKKKLALRPSEWSGLRGYECPCAVQGRGHGHRLLNPIVQCAENSGRD